MYRLVAQEHGRSPTSGRVAAFLGNYNPHKKEFNFNKEKVEFYLKNGAQPSNRVAMLLEKNKVKLPEWVKIHRAPEPPKKEEAPADDVAIEEPTEDDLADKAEIAESEKEATKE
jgi:ribosomal protein S16